MKKETVRKIISFILMIASVFIFTYLMVIVPSLFLKILMFVLLILSSLVFFIIGTYGKKKEKKEDIAMEDKKQKLCPKCYKPFDGICCFYCGYKRQD